MTEAQHSPKTTVRTIERTNIPELVPDRLADLNYDIYHHLVDFTHRGFHCDVDLLISTLGAAMENKAIKRGDSATQETLYETEAVKIAINALESHFPTWFGHQDALDDLDKPVSQDHLAKGELQTAYFNDQINPETKAVRGHNWTGQKRVIIPLLAIVLNRVHEQIQADSEAATNSAQQAIRRTILKEAVQNDLTETEIDVAVDAAVQTFEQV